MDLDREFAAVLAGSVECQARAHRADLRFLEVAREVVQMIPPEPLGHEDFDALPNQLDAGVAEDPFRVGVDADDPPVAVDDGGRGCVA